MSLVFAMQLLDAHYLKTAKRKSTRRNKSRSSSFPLSRCSRLARHSNSNLSTTVTHPVKPRRRWERLHLRRVSENHVDCSARNKESCVALSHKSLSRAFNGDLKKGMHRVHAHLSRNVAYTRDFNVNYGIFVRAAYE